MDGIEVSGNISIDIGVSNVINDYQTTLDFIAGRGVPQEVLDEVETAGSYSFCGYYVNTLRLPNLKSCGNFVFWNYVVKRISIPSVVELNWGPFNNAEKLKTVVVGTKTDSVCTVGGMQSGVSKNAKFYVPDSLLDAYKADSGWSPVASQIYPVSELPEADRDLLV